MTLPRDDGRIVSDAFAEGLLASIHANGAFIQGLRRDIRRRRAARRIAWRALPWYRRVWVQRP